MQTPDKILQIIESGGGASTVFWRGEFQNLINVWKHNDQIILTWEEAPNGAQWDESKYIRDERHIFNTAAEALAFLNSHSVALGQFTPQRKGLGA